MNGVKQPVLSHMRSKALAPGLFQIVIVKQEDQDSMFVRRPSWLERADSVSRPSPMHHV
jgi:hypothetical protein